MPRNTRLKSPKPTDQILTANDLLSGEVVYFTPDDTWAGTLDQAAVFPDVDTATARLKTVAANDASVVGAYLATTRSTGQGPQLLHFREIMRQNGPSNRFIGKQAAHAPAPGFGAENV